MVGIRPIQSAKTIVDAALEVQNLGVGLQQRYRGQESAALQTVPIEALGRGVGRGDERHSFLEKRLQQASQQHGVRDIADLELVEADDSGIRRQRVGYQSERCLLPTQRLELLVDILHEGVEVHPELGRKRQRIEKSIHNHCLAATNATPEVYAPYRPGSPGAEQAEQSAGTFTGRVRVQHALVETLERVHRVHLRGVAAQPPLLNLRHEALSESK